MQSEYPDTIWAGPPRAYGTGRDGKAVRLSVIHYTAGSESRSSAENGAAYDKTRTDGTSCHVFHDPDSSVQEVLRKDRSNSAFSKGNRLGIHHELCGTAQTRAQWLDEASDAILWRAARAVAKDCQDFGLEPRRLSVSEVRAAWYSFPNGPRGICGHVDITRAFPEDGGTHTDPGDGFPWDVFLARVNQLLNTTTSGDDDMTPEQDRRLYNLDRLNSALLSGADTVTAVKLGDGSYVDLPLAIARDVNDLKDRPAATIELSADAAAALGPVVEQAVARALERIRVEVPPAV